MGKKKCKYCPTEFKPRNEFHFCCGQKDCIKARNLDCYHKNKGKPKKEKYKCSNEKCNTMIKQGKYCIKRECRRISDREYEEKTGFNKKYREENKESIREYRKKYYQENKELFKENQKKRRRKKKESIREYHKKYYQENREDILKRYHKKDKKKLSKQKEDYYKKNSEKLKEYSRNWTKLNRLIPCKCGNLRDRKGKSCLRCATGYHKWSSWDLMHDLSFFDKNGRIKKGYWVGLNFYIFWEKLDLWDSMSRFLRKKYPYCFLCDKIVSCTDHTIHYFANYDIERSLFIDVDRNLRTLCLKCHGNKTKHIDKIIKELGYTLQEFDYLTHQQRAEIMLDFATFLMDIMKQQIALKKTKKFISKALPLIFLRTNNPTQLTLGG